jgi:hypothetical protein
MLVLAIGAIHHWASNNFYLTRIQMLFVCFLAFLLALAAFLVGLFEGEKQNPLPSYIIFHAPCLHSSLAKIVPLLLMTLTFSHICCSDKPFVGASVGYFSFLFLLAGRALTVRYTAQFSFKLHIFLFVFGFVLFLVVLHHLHLHYGIITLFVQVLLSPPIVVYSPRVRPVYVHDAHADCGKNVRCVKCPVYFCLSFVSIHLTLCNCLFFLLYFCYRHVCTITG